MRIMRSFARHLQFQPHGRNLLTQSADFWLISVRVLVFAMALAEAISWGYLGWLFSEGPQRWVSAAFVSATIFFVVWMVDLSLVTLDRAWSDHAKNILGEPPESASRRRFRDGFTFLFRVALLAGSLYITAPYLAQIVFSNEIAQFTDAEAAQAINDTRVALNQKFDAEISQKNQQIGNKREQYQAETAGKGLSGRYGEGPAAKAMLTDAQRLERERDVLLQEKEKALAEYNGLTADWRNHREELASSYNVQLPKASILQNRKALEELRKRPENRQTELAIKAFLAFIFGGLLLLKLFEPSSVRLYMSEVLQQEYLRYKAGIFDHALPEGERSTNRSFEISPQRLYSFLTNTWVPIQKTQEEEKEDIRRRQQEHDVERKSERARLEAQREKEQKVKDRLEAARLQMNAAKEALLELRSQKEKADAEAAARHDSLKTLRAAADAAEASFHDLMLTIEVVEKDVQYFDDELQRYEKLKSNLDDKGSSEISATQTQLRKKRGDATQGLLHLRESVHTEERRQERAKAELSEAEQRYAKAVQRVDDLQDKIVNMETQIAEHAMRTGAAAFASDQESYTDRTT
jgi:hypothetical protein